MSEKTIKPTCNGPKVRKKKNILKEVKAHLAKLVAGKDEDNFYRDTLRVINRLEAELTEVKKELEGWRNHI
jgi:hypothetical protein